MSFAFKVIPFTLLCLIGISSCSKPAEESLQQSQSLTLIAADLLKIQTSELTLGPMISGSLQPETKAEINAEVSGIVTKLFKDNRDVIKSGD